MFKLFKKKIAEKNREDLMKESESEIDRLQKELDKFNELFERACSDDIDTALQGSIDLARFLGVDESKIIHNDEELEAFFEG